LPSNESVMRTLHLILATALTTALAPAAGAATLYKCVDSEGKVAYSNLPCENKRDTVQTFDVVEPESADARAERLAADKKRMDQAAEGFNERHATREAARAEDARRQAEQERADAAMRRDQEAAARRQASDDEWNRPIIVVQPRRERQPPPVKRPPPKTAPFLSCDRANPKDCKR
jgi:hypothetical protein